MQKSIKTLFFVSIIALCAIAVLVGAWFLFAPAGNVNIMSQGGSPQISLLQPVEGTQLISGQVLILAATAQSDSEITRAEFLADGILVNEYFPPENNLQTVHPVFVWFSSQTGPHQLSVIAYDSIGRSSSPASVNVVVLANADGVADANLSENGAGGQASASNGENPNAGATAESGNNAGAPAAGDNLPEGQPANPIPPQPADASPQVSRFEVFVDIVIPNGGGAAVVTASTVGSGQDDLGLEALHLAWHSQDLQENGNYTENCNAQLHCETELIIPLSAGQWLISMQAIDTSGQESPVVVKIVEVLDGGDQPPAAAEHEFNPEWIQEQIASQVDRLIGIEFIPIGQGMNPIDLFDRLAGANSQPAAEEACAPEDFLCLKSQGITVTVTPEAQGNRITLVVNENFQAPDGKILIPELRKSFASHNTASLIFPPEWLAGQAATLQAGQQFSWLDTDIVCRESYRYTVGISAYEPNAIENYLAGGAYPNGSNLAYEVHTAVSQACGPGAIEDLQLTAEVRPEGVAVTWSLPANFNAPAEGIGVMLMRYNKTPGPNPNAQNTFNIYEQPLTPANLQQIRDFEVIDRELVCGNEYYYLAGVYRTGQRPGFAPEGWLAHASIPAPRHFCAEGELADIQLEIAPGWAEWVEGHYPVAKIEFDIPAAFNLLAGNNARLHLWEGSTNENGEYQLENRGNFPLRPGQNNHREFEQALSCKISHYDFYLTLESDGVTLNEGPSFGVDMPPCPPKEPPALLQLNATNQCGGAEKCVIVSWAPFQPVDQPPYQPAVRILLERKAIFSERPWVVYEPAMNAVQFTDTEVGCGVSYLYRMVAVDARGLRRSSSNFTEPPILRMDTPACGQPWALIVQP